MTSIDDHEAVFDHRGAHATVRFGPAGDCKPLVEFDHGFDGFTADLAQGRERRGKTRQFGRFVRGDAALKILNEEIDFLAVDLERPAVDEQPLRHAQAGAVEEL